MRVKTIIIISITVLITIVLMQNTDDVNFAFLWADFRISKLVMMTGVAVFAFILGVLVGRPKKVKKLGEENSLSDEDKDYIK
ncbi:MAG TPA: hypothetical protein VGI43_03905 [Mucilaginibacter sp.]